MTDKERYATIGTWEKVFREEGAKVSHTTIWNRLKVTETIGVTGRNRIGQLLRHGFYAESEVRQACFDLLNSYEQIYFRNPENVRADLVAFAFQLGEGKTPLDLNTGNIRFLSVACQTGLIMRGQTYLKNAAVALGLAGNDREAESKRAETLKFLFKTAGIETRDNSYYHTKEFVLHDLTAFSSQLGEGKIPPDLSTSNIKSLSITCYNEKVVKGRTYLHNAAIALGLAKNSRDASSRQAETLRTLKEIAGLLPESTKSND